MRTGSPARSWFSAALVLSTLLAGCITLPEPTPIENSRSRTLEQMRTCDFVIANETLDCTNAASPVTISPHPGPLWQCYDAASNPRATVKLLRNVVTSETGIWFESDRETTGLVESSAGLQSWDNGPRQGFIAGAYATSITISIWAFEKSSTTPVLANSTLHTVWSPMGPGVFPIHLLATPEVNYYVQAAAPLREPDGTIGYVLANLDLHGADFDLTITVDDLISVGFSDAPIGHVC